MTGESPDTPPDAPAKLSINDLVTKLRQGGHTQIADALESVRDQALRVLVMKDPQSGESAERSTREIISEMITIDNNDVIFGLSSNAIISNKGTVSSFIITQTCQFVNGISLYAFYHDTKNRSKYIREINAEDKMYPFCEDPRNVIDGSDFNLENCPRESEGRSQYWRAKFTKRLENELYDRYLLAFPDNRWDNRESVTGITVSIQKQARNRTDYEKVVNGPGILDLAVTLFPGVFHSPSRTGYGFSGDQLIQNIRTELAKRYGWQ